MSDLADMVRRLLVNHPEHADLEFWTLRRGSRVLVVVLGCRDGHLERIVDPSSEWYGRLMPWFRRLPAQEGLKAVPALQGCRREPLELEPRIGANLLWYVTDGGVYYWVAAPCQDDAVRLVVTEYGYEADEAERVSAEPCAVTCAAKTSFVDTGNNERRTMWEEFRRWSLRCLWRDRMPTTEARRSRISPSDIIACSEY